MLSRRPLPGWSTGKSTPEANWHHRDAVPELSADYEFNAVFGRAESSTATAQPASRRLVGDLSGRE